MKTKLKRLTVAAVAAMMAATVMAGCGDTSTTTDGSSAAGGDTAAASTTGGGRTAGSKDTLVILSAENFLGNWDPTSHTTLKKRHHLPVNPVYFHSQLF